MDPLRKGIAIGMLFGNGKEAELNDKEVEIDVGDILDALTGIFTYNPEDEDPQGDPPGPWDGYSLFTIDLTAVKQSFEDIIAALQQHDPDYDPDETPPEDAVEDLIEENEQQEQTIEDCHDCKDEVVAAIQKYVPDYQPDPDECPAPAIDDVYEKGQEDDPDKGKYTFPPDDPDNPDPDRYNKIADIVGNDPVTDEDVGMYVKYYEEIQSGGTRILRTYAYYSSVDDSYLGSTRSWQTAYPEEHPSSLHGFRVLDYTTGKYEVYYKQWTYHYPGWWYDDTRYEETDSRLIGYGDPTHNYTVKSNS